MVLAQQYARALLAVVENNKNQEKQIVEQFIRLIKRKGHQTLLPRILRLYEKELLQSRDKNTLTVTCARKEDFEKYKEIITDFLPHTSTGYTEEKIDDTIIGGYLIKKGNTIVDGSYKKKLLSIYQSTII